MVLRLEIVNGGLTGDANPRRQLFADARLIGMHSP